MTFEHPQWLWALLLTLLPLVRRRKQAARYSSFRIFPADPLSRHLSHLERALGAFFVALVVVGLSRPSLPTHSKARWVQASVTVFVVDQSGSMMVPLYGRDYSYGRDYAERRPGAVRTRLDVALQAVGELARRRPGDALGLVGFGDGPFIYAMPDTDHRALQEALAGPHINMGGTIIDLALYRALDALGGLGEPGSRAVVLVSDGEGRVENPPDLARRFIETGTFLYWVQVGNGTPSLTHGLVTLLELMGPWGQRFSAEGVELEILFERLSNLHQAPVELKYHQAARPLAATMWGAGASLLLMMGLFVWEKRWV